MFSSFCYLCRQRGWRSKLIKHSDIDHLAPNVPGKYLLPTLGGVFYDGDEKHTGRQGFSGQRTSYSDPLKFNFIELIILPRHWL